jgi:hypothetical protein
MEVVWSGHSHRTTSELAPSHLNGVATVAHVKHRSGGLLKAQLLAGEAIPSSQSLPTLIPDVGKCLRQTISRGHTSRQKTAEQAESIAFVEPSRVVPGAGSAVSCRACDHSYHGFGACIWAGEKISSMIL